MNKLVVDKKFEASGIDVRYLCEIYKNDIKTNVLKLDRLRQIQIDTTFYYRDYELIQILENCIKE